MSKTAKTATKTSKPRASRSTKKTAPAANGAETKVKGIFYVVYVDTYISDSEILPRGVYKTEESFARLDQSSSKYVRKFIGSIPDKIVTEIAEQLKVSVTDSEGNYRKSEDLLEELAVEI